MFVGKILPRKEDGQHYFINKSKSSTSSTALQKSRNNGGLWPVDKTVDAVDGGAITVSSTANKSPVCAETVDAVDNVDKNGICEGWFSEISSVSDNGKSR